MNYINEAVEHFQRAKLRQVVDDTPDNLLICMDTAGLVKVCLFHRILYFSVHGGALWKWFQKKDATALHVPFTKSMGCKTCTSVKPEKPRKRKNINRKLKFNKIRI